MNGDLSEVVQTERPSLFMRLASKIFLTSSLVILVLAGVGALSLGAVGRLVSVNREITTQTVPALRVSSGLRDQMLSLARLEARYSVLKDARYATPWRERATRADDEFDRLRTLVRTPREWALLAEAAAAFDAYRDAVAAEQARPSRERTLEEPPSRALCERVVEALARLMEATDPRIACAQAASARLVALTWTRRPRSGGASRRPRRSSPPRSGTRGARRSPRCARRRTCCATACAAR